MQDFSLKNEPCFEELQLTPITRSRGATPDLTTPATYAHINEIKRKLSNGQYTLRDKRGRSKVWQLFAVIVDENGDDIENFVACRDCHNVHKFQMSTSNLMKHKCAGKLEDKSRNLDHKPAPDVPLDEATLKRVLDAVTGWSIHNCRPPSILEESEFVNLVRILLNVGANYGEHMNIGELLPEPRAVTRNISDIYNEHLTTFAEKLRTVASYSLAMHVWTDSFQERHAVLTMHYIHQSAVINRLLSVTALSRDDLNADNSIREWVNASLQKFDLEGGDTAVIVTENDAYMRTARGGQPPHIVCINTQLNEAIDTVFMETPELQLLFQKCSTYVRACRKSKSGLQTPLDRISGVFRTVKDYWSEVSLAMVPQDAECVRHADILAMIKILSQFENSLKELEAQEEPTLHMVIPHLHKLRKLCGDLEDEDVAVEAILKIALKPHLESIAAHSISKYHKIALLLFPPTNTLLLFDDSEKQATIGACKTMMDQFCVESESSQCKRIRPDSSEYNGIFSDFITPSWSWNNSDVITHEINGYLRMQVVLRSDFNLLHWWKENESLFPLLYKVSRKVFSIPASAAFARNTLLQARSLISEPSNSNGDGDGDLVNKILFLNNNLKIG